MKKILDLIFGLMAIVGAAMAVVPPIIFFMLLYSHDEISREMKIGVVLTMLAGIVLVALAMGLEKLIIKPPPTPLRKYKGEAVAVLVHFMIIGCLKALDMPSRWLVLFIPLIIASLGVITYFILRQPKPKSRPLPEPAADPHYSGPIHPR